MFRLGRFLIGPVAAGALTPFLPIVIAGCLWSIVIFYFLWKAASPKRATVVFLFLLTALSLFRLESFRFRPYWDSILGCFAEATFLLKHNFDYSLLIHQQPYLLGGPKVYVLRLYPTYLALLMKLLPSSNLFFPAVHLLGFIAAGIALTVFFRLLHTCMDRQYAALGVVLLMMDPLFLAQAEAINMETWIVLAGLLGLSALVRRRMLLTAAFSLLAILVKGSGVVFSAALLGTYIVISRDGRPRYLRSIGLLSIPLLLFIAYVLYVPALGLQGDFEMGWFSGLLPMIDILRRYLPLTYALSVVLGVFGIYAFFHAGMIAVRDRRSSRLGALFHRVRGVLQSTHPVLMFSLIFLVSFHLFHMQFGNILPRYFLIQAPFLLVALLYVVRFEFVHRGFRLAFLLLCLAWTLVNVKGDLLEKDLSSNGHYLESTLAYVDDLRFQTGLAKLLESHYGDRWIMTSWPMTQMLSLPQLGYVEKPMKVISAGRPCRYCGSALYLPEVRSGFEWKDTVACFVDNLFSGKDAGLFQYDPLEEFREGQRRAQIYQATPKRAITGGTQRPSHRRRGVHALSAEAD